MESVTTEHRPGAAPTMPLECPPNWRGEHCPLDARIEARLRLEAARDGPDRHRPGCVERVEFRPGLPGGALQRCPRARGLCHPDDDLHPVPGPRAEPHQRLPAHAARDRRCGDGQVREGRVPLRHHGRARRGCRAARRQHAGEPGTADRVRDLRPVLPPHGVPGLRALHRDQPVQPCLRHLARPRLARALPGGVRQSCATRAWSPSHGSTAPGPPPVRPSASTRCGTTCRSATPGSSCPSGSGASARSASASPGNSSCRARGRMWSSISSSSSSPSP